MEVESKQSWIPILLIPLAYLPIVFALSSNSEKKDYTIIALMPLLTMIPIFFLLYNQPSVRVTKIERTETGYEIVEYTR